MILTGMDMPGQRSFALEPPNKQAKSESLSEDQVRALIEQAGQLKKAGNYAAASQIWEHLARWAIEALGPDHPAVATSLNNLANLYINQGSHSKAELLLQRSLEISEKALGPEHPNVAISLNNLASLYAETGQLEKAKSMIKYSSALSEKALGSDHPKFATSLHILAGLYLKLGDYSRAESSYRRSLDISEKALGLNHPNVAASLDGLAKLYIKQGEYTKAEPLLLRSLAISEKALGQDHPDTATSLSSLALLYFYQGLYSSAERLYQHSLAISEQKLGSNHPEVAIILNKLALLNFKQGRYNKAEQMYQRSLTISANVLGLEHPDVASILSNLALLYVNQGQLTKAEQLFQRSLAISVKALGPEHPDVASDLHNLAMILVARGQYNKAESLYFRALSIDKKAIGREHLNAAVTLSNIALLYVKQGQYSKGEGLYQRSLSIREKSLGPGHPDVATSLNNLALLYFSQGQYSKAEPLYQRSLAIMKKSLGAEHPNAVLTLGNLALLYETQALHDRSIQLIGEAIGIENKWLYGELQYLPDHLRQSQLSKLGSTWMFPFGMLTMSTDAANIALVSRLNRQGLLQEIEKRQVLALRAPGPQQEKYLQLQVLTQELANVSLQPERRAALREEHDRLQAELFRSIPGLQLKPVAVKDVASALPADGVLVEFQRFEPFDGRKSRGERWGNPQYVALILKPDASISAVQLGAADPIETAIQHALLASAKDKSDASDLWSKVTDLVMAPLQSHLAGRRQVFLSTDGELNRIPFLALPLPKQSDRLLSEEVEINVITTGRDLLTLRDQGKTSTKPGVVMVNPTYSFSQSGRTSPQLAAIRPASRPQQRSAEQGTKSWDPLPASQQEGQQLAALLKQPLLSGDQATTPRLQQLQSPRLLHIATHGFFLPDPQQTPADLRLAIGTDSPLLSKLQQQEDPMLRSGLALAGANQPEANPNDDGHLTAKEAAALQLEGTELVVLSACSTAQGDARTGEGVYGLQRALTVAGARSTLLSLWKVDDAATAEFMRRYYTRLKAGEGRRDALIATQREFRLGQVRSADGNGNDWQKPYYWAAWQLVGDWRPIPGL